MIVVPSGNRAGASLRTDATPTASEAAGEPTSTGVPSGDVASAVALAGAASEGGVVSATVTSCSAAAELPAASAAVQVTTVVPIGNRAGASLDIDATPTASDAVAAPWSTAVPDGPAASARAAAGAYTDGGVVSDTETTCESDASLPAASDAVHVTTVLPTGNAAGASLVTAATPTASDASGSPMSTTLESAAAASTATSAGARTSGGVVSDMATVCRACAALPAASAAVHVTTVSPTGYDAGASLPSSATPTASDAVALPMSASAVDGPVASAEAVGGAISSGGVVSRTTTRWTAVASFPAASVAVQVTVVVPSGNTAGASLETDATPTASVASGEPTSTGAPSGDAASAVASGGGTIEGGVVSTTFTSCSAVASFPAASVAVQVTVVAPSGNTAGASLETDATPTASVASGEPTSTGAPSGDAASAVASGGGTIEGGVVSTTFTSCSAVASFPAASVAVQVTTVLPRASTGGASFVTDAIGVASAAAPSPAASPTAIRPSDAAAPSADSASTVRAGGTRIDGGVVSTISTRCDAAALLPDASVAFHTTVCEPSEKAPGASLDTVTSCASSTDGSPSSTSLRPADSASSTTSGGASIAGGVVSTISTRCLAAASLPAASRAVHVTTVVPIGNRAGASLATDAIPDPPSAAAGSPSSTAFEAADSASNTTSGGARTDGAAVSETDTLCGAVASLPATSRAVHVTTVVPSGNRAGASLDTDITPTASTTAGSASSTGVPSAPAASAAASWTAAIDGGIVSRTVTFCVATAMLPAPSIAVQITVLIPRVNRSGALLSSESMPLASVATARPMLTGVSGPVASAVMSAGGTIAGFVRSAPAAGAAAAAARCCPAACCRCWGAGPGPASSGAGAPASPAGSENACMRWPFESTTYSMPAEADTATSSGSLNWPAWTPSPPHTATGAPDASSSMTRLLDGSAAYRPPPGAAARPCARTSSPPTLASYAGRGCPPGPNLLMLAAAGSDTYTVPDAPTATPCGETRASPSGRPSLPISETYVPLAVNSCTRRLPVSAT